MEGYCREGWLMVVVVMEGGGYAGSQGPGDDELGGVGDEPRCSAWLMRKASKLQCPTPPPPSPLLFSFILFSQV